MGDCHPILARGTPLFPTRVPRENRWLSMAVPFVRVAGLATQRMRFVEATKKALAGLNVRSQCRRVKGVCRGGCFRGLLVEVSLALVGVASPAMFQLYQTSYHYASPNPKYYRFVAKKLSEGGLGGAAVPLGRLFSPPSRGVRKRSRGPRGNQVSIAVRPYYLAINCFCFNDLLGFSSASMSRRETLLSPETAWAPKQ